MSPPASTASSRTHRTDRNRARVLAARVRRATGQDPLHPQAVAELVEKHGGSETEIVAALLHDAVEDGVPARLVREQFGDEVAVLVEAMTDDESIGDYRERKEDTRRRVFAAGVAAVRIFAADKTDNARTVRARVKPYDESKVREWRASLALIERDYPDLPLSSELARALDELASSISSS